MKKYTLALLFILNVSTQLNAQFSDNFTDGDFTTNPAWSGGVNDFTVNTSLQLQSTNAVANAAFYLSTPSTKATTAQWDIYVQLAFNTSSANFVDVFLTASAADVTLPATTGYFVRLGGTTDEISLYRKDAGTATKIIDGLDGTLNNSNNTIKLSVIRDATNLWQLRRDLTGTGASLVTEGTVSDATYTTSAFFSIYVKQSTASFFGKHFFDDIVVSNYAPDVTPPVINQATATGPNSLDVLFNEPVSLASSQNAANYSVSNGVGSASTAVRDATNTALVHLIFTNPFPVRTNLTLTVNAVSDLAGNATTNASAMFSYYVALPYDVVIDEIFADPTPQVGLPNAEWIELKNVSGLDMNLQGFRLAKSSGNSGLFPAYILRADSFVIVTSTASQPLLASFGPAIGLTSFPALGNEGDLVYLLSKENTTLHAVNYNVNWYQNELKKEGGWSLEMIDPKNPCTGMDNWRASVDPSGGTPGRKNSIDAVNIDATAPTLLRAFATDATHITLTFSENTDSLSAATAANYIISNGIGSPASAVAIAPLFNMATITLTAPLQPNTVYNVTATNIKDCKGNIINSNNTVNVGVPGNLLPFDVVVNEILFNPKPGAEDYVELYNRSNKIINLKNAYLANRSSSNSAVSNITQISGIDYPLFPDEYIVCTRNKQSLLQNYVALNPAAIIEMATPSYNDDEGNVILLNEQGNIIDEIAYKDDWHFALISNDEGVALERIEPNDTSLVPAKQQANWHSAASNIGFGTPTYKNSQFKSNQTVQGDITTLPEIISPDNDGVDDFATINYNFPEAGYVSNITIFDAQGRPVRYLQKNALNGTSGFYRWDGLGEKQQKLPVGLYIIYSEVFNLQGKVKKFKSTIVLARRN